jgi:hypothetical protein
VLILAIITYLAAFYANGIKVVSISYCGDSGNLLYNETDTLSLLPYFIRPLARTCLFETGTGDLSRLVDEKNHEHYTVIEKYLEILDENFNLNLDKEDN